MIQRFLFELNLIFEVSICFKSYLFDCKPLGQGAMGSVFLVNSPDPKIDEISNRFLKVIQNNNNNNENPSFTVALKMQMPMHMTTKSMSDYFVAEYQFFSFNFTIKY